MLNVETDPSGSTAVMLIIVEDRMYVANVGDSVAIFSRRGKCEMPCVLHQPSNPEEEKRITKCVLCVCACGARV